jgi:hypothetical protein
VQHGRSGGVQCEADAGRGRDQLEAHDPNASLGHYRQVIRRDPRRHAERVVPLISGSGRQRRFRPLSLPSQDRHL